MYQKSSTLAASVIGLFVLLNLDLSSCFHLGAPSYSCRNLRPGHSNGTQSSPAPYSLSASNPVIAPGRSTIVTLESTGDFPFKGFLCAISELSDANNFPVGEISVMSPSPIAVDVQTVQCSRATPNTAITHNSAKEKFRVDFRWTPPADAQIGQQYKLRCVGVLSFSMCWNNLRLQLSIGNPTQSTPVQPPVTRPTSSQPGGQATNIVTNPTRDANNINNNNNNGASNTVLFPPVQPPTTITNANQINSVPAIPPSQLPNLSLFPNVPQTNLFAGTNPLASLPSATGTNNNAPLNIAPPVQSNNIPNMNSNNPIFPSNSENNILFPTSSNNDFFNNNSPIILRNNDNNILFPGNNNNGASASGINNVEPISASNDNINLNLFGSNGNNNNNNAAGAFTSNNNNLENSFLVSDINNIPTRLGLFDQLESQPASNPNNVDPIMNQNFPMTQNSRNQVRDPPRNRNANSRNNPVNTPIIIVPPTRTTFDNSRNDGFRNGNSMSDNDFFRTNGNSQNQNLVRPNEQFFDINEVTSTTLLDFGFPSSFFFTPGAIRMFRQRNNIV